MKEQQKEVYKILVKLGFKNDDIATVFLANIIEFIEYYMKDNPSEVFKEASVRMNPYVVEMGLYYEVGAFRMTSLIEDAYQKREDKSLEEKMFESSDVYELSSRIALHLNQSKAKFSKDRNKSKLLVVI